MSDLPASFRAYVVDRPEGGAFSRGLRDMTPADLPPGEVTVRVEWSGVNFKDGLAAREDGRVARGYPLIPGIDLAGTVVASDDDAFPVGAEVLANGYDIGTARHGGYGELARVPSGWVVPLPDGLTARDAMAIGTAGFTAAMSVQALEDHGLAPGRRPGAGDGCIGRRGLHGRRDPGGARPRGLGGDRARPDEEAASRDLGAAGIADARRGHGRRAGRWTRRAGRGPWTRSGAATLPYVLRTLRARRGGGELRATRAAPTSRRRSSRSSCAASRCWAWTRRTWPSSPAARCGAASRRTCSPRGIDDGITEVDLETLEPALDAIVAGQARGRWVVRVGA